MLMWRSLSGTSIVACLDSLLSTLSKSNSTSGADKDAARANGDDRTSTTEDERDEKVYSSSNI